MKNIFKRKEKAPLTAVQQKKMILDESSPFIMQEAYKTMRTNLLFALRGNGSKRFCITSSIPGEGKSITILNLAISIAQTGKKVLLIDADLRRPSLARLLGDDPVPGVSNVLVGQANVETAIRENVRTNLDVLYSGDVPPNPSELLGSEQMQELIEAMSREYDYVLVDAPPVNLVSDCCILANFLDGVVLLARSGIARKEGVKQAINQLRLTNTKVLGCVINGVEVASKKYYRYNYK